MIGWVALALFQAAAPPVVAWTVRPDSVAVADAFTVTLAVRAPANTPVLFPPGPDSAQMIEAVDPPAVAAVEDSAGTIRTATYRLVAWETGTQVVPLAAVVVGDGALAQHLEVRPTVFVRSVLPPDSARRVPRPALGVLLGTRAWWPYAIAALAAIALLLWVRHRRRRRRVVVPPLSALARAERAMARVESLGLIEAGEPSRYVALHADVLRGYLSARADAASRSHTTGELVAELRARTRGIGLPLDRIAAVLGECDQVQFARRAVGAERAKEIAKEIQQLIAAADEPFNVLQARAREGARSAPPSPRRVA